MKDRGPKGQDGGGSPASGGRGVLDESNPMKDLELERSPVGSGTADSSNVVESGGEPAESATDELRRFREQIESLEDRLLRDRAEFQNVQRRSQQERQEAVRYANAELMQGLLPVVDDLERAMASAEPPAAGSSSTLLDGVRLVRNNLLNILRGLGLEPIDALHQPFDPRVHEALMQQPTDEDPPGTVIQELTRGYRLHDRVLRPARVVVARPAGNDSGEGTKP